MAHTAHIPVIATIQTSVITDRGNYLQDITSGDGDTGTQAARIHGIRYGRNTSGSNKQSEDSYCVISHFDGGMPLAEAGTESLRDAIMKRVRERTKNGPGAATFATAVTGEDGISFGNIGDSHILLVAQDGDAMKLSTPHEGISMEGKGGALTNWIGTTDKKKCGGPFEEDQAGFISYERIKSRFGDQPVKVIMASDGLLEQYRNESGIFHLQENHADMIRQDEAAMSAFVRASASMDAKILAANAFKSGSQDDITVVTMDAAPGHAASLSDGMGGYAHGKTASRKAVEAATAEIQKMMKQHGIASQTAEAVAFDPELTGRYISTPERKLAPRRESVPPPAAAPDIVRILLEGALQDNAVSIDLKTYPSLKGDTRALIALQAELKAEGVRTRLLPLSAGNSVLIATDSHDSAERLNPLLKQLQAAADIKPGDTPDIGSWQDRAVSPRPGDKAGVGTGSPGRSTWHKG